VPRRFFCLLLALLCCFGAARAGDETAVFTVEDSETGFFVTDETEDFPPAEYSFSKKQSAHYESDTLIYTVERFTIGGVTCLLTKIWVQDPERQIRKVNAPWGESLDTPLNLARKIPETVLATNASGYITKKYPDIPDNYPGKSEDYFNTTLGSLVITDGEVLRDLEGVPFYGLALSSYGITLYRGTDNRAVLATQPTQTWAFFEPCAMQVNGEDLLPPEGTWDIARERHPRTILARVNRNNYLMLHVTGKDEGASGLTLYRINTFFFDHFETEWVYNLDGGYSTALMIRKQQKNARLNTLVPSKQRVADVICFTE